MIVFDPRFYELYPECRPDRIKKTRAAWDRLSELDQTITVLICLGYPMTDIARMTQIKYSTVVCRVRKILAAFHVFNRVELGELLRSWDLSKWEEWSSSKSTRSHHGHNHPAG